MNKLTLLIILSLAVLVISQNDDDDDLDFDDFMAKSNKNYKTKDEYTLWKKNFKEQKKKIDSLNSNKND